MRRTPLDSGERESKAIKGMEANGGERKRPKRKTRTYDLVYSTYSSRYIPLYVVSKQWQFAVGTGLAAAPRTTNSNGRLHAQQ